MRTINPHTLLTDKPKEIIVNSGLDETYKQWQKIMSEKINRDVNNFDAFVAGYFLANPLLRDKFMKLNNIQEYDNGKY